jgi:hypothetical protein
LPDHELVEAVAAGARGPLAQVPVRTSLRHLHCAWQLEPVRDR